MPQLLSCVHTPVRVHVRICVWLCVHRIVWVCLALFTCVVCVRTCVCLKPGAHVDAHLSLPACAHQRTGRGHPTPGTSRAFTLGKGRQGASAQNSLGIFHRPCTSSWKVQRVQLGTGLWSS